MNPIFTLITFALLSASSASYAQKSISIECKSTQAHCPNPPIPPLPPAPHLPPEPPSDLNFPSAPPVPPMPPAPPKIIAPPQTHAACQNKEGGFKITWIIDQTTELSGKCVQQNGKMMFEIESMKVSHSDHQK
jgi:hypothetical protein